MVMGSSCFAIKLWWEVPAWLSVVVPASLKNRGSPESVRARIVEKIRTEEGVTTNAIETQSKKNNVSLWCCDGSEKGVTVSTSLLDEISKSRIDDCAGKGGEDSGRKKEVGGCPRSSSSQNGFKFKKKRKVALNRNEVRSLTKARKSGPKSIANKNDKVGLTKVSSPVFEARNQEERDKVEEALEEDQAHLLAQPSLKKGLCLGERKSLRSLSTSILSSKDASYSRDVRACDPAVGFQCCCDALAGIRDWKSEISEELGLSRRNQATHEMLREEGSRYAPFISRGSCEFSSSSGSPFSPSSGKRKDLALARVGLCLNEVVYEKEERIFSDPFEVIEPEIEEDGTPLSSEGFLDKILDKGYSPLRVSPLAVWASKGSKEKGFFPRVRVHPGLEDVEVAPIYESSSLEGQDSLLPLSVFGRVLLPGDFSGAGGSVDVDDRDTQVPWCMVDTNGKEGAMLNEGSLMEVEVECGFTRDWTRTENLLVDSEIGYESWEESCLVKFSEFLGFSTKGHEREILSLLRSLIVKHNQMRSKGQQIISRCERSLKSWNVP